MAQLLHDGEEGSSFSHLTSNEPQGSSLAEARRREAIGKELQQRGRGAPPTGHAWVRCFN